jgi:serine/threonine protein kinase
MSRPLPCPATELLKQLEIIALDPSHAQDLRFVEEHVEACQGCQQRLDQILAEDQQEIDKLLVEPIPGYRTLKLLGRGGQACVYLAVEQSTRRHVALKIIPKPASDSNFQIDAWRREILVAARMDHVNLVRLYSVHENQHAFILVFEYIAGGTLQSVFSRDCKPNDIAKLMIQIAHGLSKIHSMGFLHLDLKPSNILIDRSAGDSPDVWVPKISDFGISRAMGSTGGPIEFETLQTHTSEDLRGLGTLQYMAPEQTLGLVELLTPRADLFALGRILHRWLDAIGDSANQTGLRSIYKRCLEIDPDRRYASTAEFIGAIETWRNQTNKNLRKRFPALQAIMWVFIAVSLVVSLGQWSRLHRSENPPKTMDLATWLATLDTAPEAITDSIAEELTKSSVRWTQTFVANGLVSKEPEQALRFAVLQRSAAERMAGKLDTQRMPLARELLSNAMSLMASLRAHHPEDSSLLKEAIATHYAAGQLRYHSQDIPHYDEYFQSRLEAIEATCRLVVELKDPVQQIYWSTRVLDELRVSRRTALWGTQTRCLELVTTSEKTCAQLLKALCVSDPQLQSQDLQVRLRLALSPEDEPQVLEQLSHSEAARNWVFVEEIPTLARELIAAELGCQVFEFHGDSQLDPREQIALLRDRLADIPGGDAILPLVFQEDLIRFVAGVSTHHRLRNELVEAERIQKCYMAMCEACMDQFSDHPNLYLAQSEAYLQAWKNALRRDALAEAFNALTQSYRASQRALELAPNNPLAHHQVSDRLKRITRFQSQNKPSSIEQRTDSNHRRTMLDGDLKVVTHPHR